MTVSLVDVTTHNDVPTSHIEDYKSFEPFTSPGGVAKYQARLPKNTHLDALLINQQSDVLVVAFHGATNRQTKTLPRFEWMRTLRKTEYSSMYFSDPCLNLNERLALAWYTGWEGCNLYPIIADWITKAAEAVNASNIVLLGSSGGGFASLQISSYIPESVALSFNSQTRISSYRSSGVNYGHQRSYLRHVMPHLKPPTKLEELEPEYDWAASMGERLSVIARYRHSQPNFVYYVQNMNDYHHVDDHYLPFRQSLENGPNRDHIRFVEYDGAESHVPPTPRVFRKHLQNAVEWIRTNSGMTIR